MGGRSFIGLHSLGQLNPIGLHSLGQLGPIDGLECISRFGPIGWRVCSLGVDGLLLSVSFE